VIFRKGNSFTNEFLYCYCLKLEGVHTIVLVINTGNKCSVKTQLISLLDYVLSNNSKSNTYITTCFNPLGVIIRSYKELRKTFNYIYGLAKRDPVWCLQYEFFDVHPNGGFINHW
jgi:hypothetical protein